jgi:transposase InsO family protein
MNKFQSISNEETFIGIDVAKDELKLFVYSLNQHSSCKNQLEDLRKMAREFKKLNPALIVMEATGGYEKSRFSYKREVETRLKKRRIHSSLGYLTPSEFEEKWQEEQTRLTQKNGQNSGG